MWNIREIFGLKWRKEGNVGVNGKIRGEESGKEEKRGYEDIRGVDNKEKEIWEGMKKRNYYFSKFLNWLIHNSLYKRSPRHKDIKINVTWDEEKQQILTAEELEPENICHFVLWKMTKMIDQLSKQLPDSFSRLLVPAFKQTLGFKVQEVNGAHQNELNVAGKVGFKVAGSLREVAGKSMNRV